VDATIPAWVGEHPSTTVSPLDHSKLEAQHPEDVSICTVFSMASMNCHLLNLGQEPLRFMHLLLEDPLHWPQIYEKRVEAGLMNHVSLTSFQNED
jgi:hypothetical protein